MCGLLRTPTDIMCDDPSQQALSTHTQIIFEMSVFFMHNDFIYRYPLLVTWLNFAIIFAENNGPKCWQR